MNACRLLAVLLTASALAAGCGGGSGGADAAQASSTPSPAAASDTASMPAPAAQAGDTPMAAGLPLADPLAPDPGMLLMLVGDGVAAADPGVGAWMDAASEVGTRLTPISDAQLLALGTPGLLGFAGLVLPDQLHAVASDAVVSAIGDYARNGGRTLLVYDFGALTLNGNGQPVFPIAGSRFADLAGVNYVLYDQLRDRTVGLGPVTALESTIRTLLVPPGKSVVHTEAAASAITGAGLQPGESLFLGPTTADPGAARSFDPQQQQAVRPGTGPGRRANRARINFGGARKAPAVRGVTAPRPAPASSIAVPASGSNAAALPQAAALPEPLVAYSGYLLGELIYPSFVTSGDYAGRTLASSPQFGLVAGILPTGSGTTMFVNLPLTYLKGRTDALPMHGFLHAFVRQVVHAARLSAMPNAVAGLTLDWHFDSRAAQAPALALERAGVFKRGGFSIEMTAGPDTVSPGDGLGWNLPQNPTAQALLRRLDGLGHAIGSHGGWIHDYYGLNATESNEADFLPLLVLNRDAVDAAVGHKGRSYSAPEGNNPTWAMDWLEQQGIVGTYFGGHTGLGATRQYRDGVLRNPALWVFPVTPQGFYATFEEFQEYGVPKADVKDWYHQLVDFSIAMNTSRLVYMHPPGANQWSDVVQDLIAYAASKNARFAWYPMPRLADFMAARSRVSWSQVVKPNGATHFLVSHPQSLREMVWLLPKERYLKPTIATAGGGTVADGGDAWMVKAAAVPVLEFNAKPNPVPIAQ